MNPNDPQASPDTEAFERQRHATPRPATAAVPTPAPTKHADQADTRRVIAKRYVVLKELGRGGMGVVYLAHDKDLNRDVALKVVNAGPDADPTELARFQFEAETAANLHHPNIVPVYDVGRDDGVAYMAMEYVKGGNLYRRINKQPMPIAEAAAFLEPIARAMHYAHVHDVIHRDLKPSNILLEEIEGNVEKASPDTRLIPGVNLPLPKIADFGLAKHLEHSMNLTLTGVAVGTPHYMAPEQARGDSDNITPLTDVFALGSILYEMLIGYPPFTGANSLETMENVVHRKALPPSKFRAAVPPQLDAICMKCLEKKPQDRYPSAEALADALNVFLTGEVISQVHEPVPSMPNIKPPSRLVPMLVGAMAITPVVMFLTWFVVNWMQPKSETPSLPPETSDFVTPLREQLQAHIEIERALQFSQARAELEQGRLELGLTLIRGLLATEPLRPDGTLTPLAKQASQLLDAWSPYILERGRVVPHPHVTHVCFAHQSPVYATAGGSVVKFWDSKTDTELRESITVSGVVTALAFSVDDRYCAIGTSDRQVQIWNVATNARVGKPIMWEKAGPPVCLAFTDEDHFLRVGPTEGPLQVYVVQTGALQEAKNYQSPERSWRWWAIHANGFAIAADEQGGLYAWNNDVPKTTTVPPPTLGVLADLQISPDARYVAALTQAGSVKQFARDEGRWLDMPNAGHVTALAYAPDGNIMVIGKQNGRVQLWDAVARQPLTESIALGASVLRVDVARDGSIMAATSKGEVYSLRFKATPFVAPTMWLEHKPGKEILNLAFSPDGTKLYVTSPWGVSRWHITQGTRLNFERAYLAEKQGNAVVKNPPAAMHFTASVVVPAVRRDPEALLVGGAGGRLFLLDTSNATAANLANGQLDEAEQVTSVTTTREGHTTGATGRCKNGKGVVAYWTQGMGVDQAKKKQFEFVVNQAYFSRNARELILGCSDGTIRRLDVINHELLSDQYQCGSPVLCVSINDEGNRILAGCADGSAHLWDIYERRAVQILRHTSEVRAVAFANGLITAGADGTWRRWDEATGHPLGPAHHHADAITSLAVRGDMLATGSRDRSIRVWRLP